MGPVFPTDFSKMFLEGIAEFLALMRFGLSWGQEHLLSRIGGTILIFSFFWLIRSVLTKLILKNIEWLILRENPTIKERVLEEIERPIGFVPVILGIYVSLEYLMPDLDLKYKIPLFMSLGSVSLFWVIYNLIHPIAYFFNRVAKVNSAVLDWIVRFIRIIVVFVGLSSVLEMWGIEVAPIIAGLGLFGMAVALGAQDMFKNILAGLAIISEKRFQVGQIVRLSEEVEGVVEHIGFRSTLIRRFDKAPVYVPNGDLASSAVVNFSERTNRQIMWKVGLEYRTSVEQLRYIRAKIEAFILKSPDFSKPPESPIHVRLTSFSDSAIVLMVYCFSASRKWKNYLESKENLILYIKQIVEEAGASLAFPSQSLYVEQLLSDRSVRGKISKKTMDEISALEKENKRKITQMEQIDENN